MGKRIYTDEQLNILKEHYPKGDWKTIEETFPNKSRANIRGIARKRNLKKDIDLTGKTFGRLKVICRNNEKNMVMFM